MFRQKEKVGFERTCIDKLTANMSNGVFKEEKIIFQIGIVWIKGKFAKGTLVRNEFYLKKHKEYIDYRY